MLVFDARTDYAYELRVAQARKPTLIERLTATMRGASPLKRHPVRSLRQFRCASQDSDVRLAERVGRTPHRTS